MRYALVETMLEIQWTLLSLDDGKRLFMNVIKVNDMNFQLACGGNSLKPLIVNQWGPQLHRQFNILLIAFWSLVKPKK